MASVRGTSELLHVKCGADGLPDCTCIGGTTDLAAGQLLDRAGNLLGLPFPSGGALDALALTAEPEKGFKPKVNECKFSLSGMQNQVENKFKTAEPKQMARFALETVANAPSSRRPSRRASSIIVRFYAPAASWPAKSSVPA